MSQRQQSICRLRTISGAHYHVRNTTLHRDFKLDTVEKFVHTQIKKLYASLNDHPNSPAGTLSRYDFKNPYYKYRRPKNSRTKIINNHGSVCLAIGPHIVQKQYLPIATIVYLPIAKIVYTDQLALCYHLCGIQFTGKSRS